MCTSVHNTICYRHNSDKIVCKGLNGAALENDVSCLNWTSIQRCLKKHRHSSRSKITALATVHCGFIGTQRGPGPCITAGVKESPFPPCSRQMSSDVIKPKTKPLQKPNFRPIHVELYSLHTTCAFRPPRPNPKPDGCLTAPCA